MNIRQILTGLSLKDLQKLAKYFNIPISSSKRGQIDNLLLVQKGAGRPSAERLEKMPYLILWDFLLGMDCQNLQKLCKTFKTARTICKKPAFWREKYEADYNNGERVPSSYLQKLDILTWQTLYLGRCRVGKEYPATGYPLTEADIAYEVTPSTRLPDDVAEIKSLLGTEIYGFAIKQKNGTVIPVFNTYTLHEKYPEETDDTLNLLSDPQIHFERNYRNKLIEDPEGLLLNRLKPGDSLIFYLYSGSSVVAAIATKTGSGFNWSYRKGHEKPLNMTLTAWEEAHPDLVDLIDHVD